MTVPASFVLDTNVVLAWLVFRDPSLAPALDGSVGAGRARWIASAAMRDEFAEVLRRGLAGRIGVSYDDALDGWRRHATLVPEAAPSQRCRCRDAADQKFVDVSLQYGVRWLLTRDRDLLALQRCARDLGLCIATPAAWLLSGAAVGQ